MMMPAAVETWESIKADGGYKAMQAFDKVWYHGGRLTPDEEVQLKKLFEKYPLGETNFKAWYKQRVRQTYEKCAIIKTNGGER